MLEHIAQIMIGWMNTNITNLRFRIYSVPLTIDNKCIVVKRGSYRIHNCEHRYIRQDFGRTRRMSSKEARRSWNWKHNKQNIQRFSWCFPTFRAHLCMAASLFHIARTFFHWWTLSRQSSWPKSCSIRSNSGPDRLNWNCFIYTWIYENFSSDWTHSASTSVHVPSPSTEIVFIFNKSR